MKKRRRRGTPRTYSGSETLPPREAGRFTGPPHPERFWAKVLKTDGCWLWQAATNKDGYGHYRLDGKTREAHVVAYGLLVGPVPPGHVLDHVRERGCANRHCVNPAHLEPVTRRVNTLRGDGITAQNARLTHCLHGHPFDSENTYWLRGRRYCRECGRIRYRAYTRRKRGEVAA